VADQLGPAQALKGLGGLVVEAVAARADRRGELRLGEPLVGADRQVLPGFKGRSSPSSMPADGVAPEHVDHESGVDTAGESAGAYEVGDPQLVRCVGPEPPRRPRSRISRWTGQRATGVPSRFGCAHPVGAVDPPLRLSDAADTHRQPAVAHARRRRRPRRLGVVGRRNDQRACGRSARSPPRWVRVGRASQPRRAWVALPREENVAAFRIPLVHRTSRFPRANGTGRWRSVVTPGRWPPSTSARRIHSHSVSGAPIANLPPRR
jgi:hypothetical protein